MKMYKRKPRIKKEGDKAVISIKGRTSAIMRAENVRARVKAALKRPEGRPKKGTPKVTVTGRPGGKAKYARVREDITVNVDMTPDPPKAPCKPRGKAFEKGNPWAWKPGQGGGGGKRKGTGIAVISKAYTAQLTSKVPVEVAEALGFDTEHLPTWAEAMAAGVIARAVAHDTPAAKEVREVTEGRLPESLSVDGKIDYTAGESAKDRLLGKLMGAPDDGTEQS